MEKGDRWITDSGATCHITSMLNKLIFAPSCLGRRVYLPSGASTLVSYVDKCETTDGNVLSVPAFKHDFISISHMTKKN